MSAGDVLEAFLMVSVAAAMRAFSKDCKKAGQSLASEMALHCAAQAEARAASLKPKEPS